MCEFYDKLAEIIGADRVLLDEPMRSHITFRVGGCADYFVSVKNAEEIRQIIELCRQQKVPFYVIGNGSNLLVGDRGIRGCVIQVGRAMSGMTVQEDQILVQAGTLLSQIGNRALEEGLTGFEFASGIPGTLGGAVSMNAGAYGGEMKDVLVEVRVLTQDGKIRTLKAEELELGYRTSLVAKEGSIVLDALLQLEKGDTDKIRARMNELRMQRTTKQPLEFPSAGSTFKRPEGHFAGKLIQDAGLAGLSVGGAKVSEKHCGFVINTGDATAADVMGLIAQVQEKVRERFGVELEMEVRCLGEF